MKRLVLLVAVMALAVTGVAFAQAKPDFSGTWTLDPSKSDQMGGGGMGRGPGGPMTIKQTATEVVVERTMGGEPVTQTYKLDGTESVNTVRQMQAKSKASIEGGKLVIKTTMETPNGTMESTGTYTLSADGKELTVLNVSARGERKAVYTKK